MLIAFGDFVACVTPLLAQALRAIETRLNDADDTEAVQAIHSAMTQLMAAFQVITTVEKTWKTKVGRMSFIFYFSFCSQLDVLNYRLAER